MSEDMNDKLLASKQKRVEGLEKSNQESYEGLQMKIPNFSMDTTGARLELLIATLVDAGALTALQHVDFEIAFHEKVQSALDSTWEQVREQEARSKIVTPRPKPVRLIGPDGHPL